MNAAHARLARIFQQVRLEANDMPVMAGGGQLNQVWVCGNYVVRMNLQTNGQSLHNEAELLQAIPASIPHPTVIAVGRDPEGEWQVQNRVAGHPLTQVWTTLSVPLRQQAVRQLATVLQNLHTWKPARSALPNLPHFATYTELVEQITQLATQSQQLPFVDARLMDAVIAVAAQMAQKIPASTRRCVVHKDLHFDNILWDGQTISALLDFEKACFGPPTLELDLLLRFCAYPALYVHEEFEHLVHAEDYRLVPEWLAANYPALFADDTRVEQLRLYSLIYDLQLLQRYPPGAEVDPDAGDHLLNRIRAVVEHRSRTPE